jgi:hypothetical protein
LALLTFNMAGNKLRYEAACARFSEIIFVEDRMIVRILLMVCSLLLASELPAASQQPKDDPWNPQHIDALPPDIRHYIAAICKGPAKAQHDFATYSPTERRWRINLEYLGCDGLRDFRRGHQCLDVDFVQVGSRFRLASKQYRECGF